MMLIQQEPRNCIACGKPIKGRSDKRFCDDYCRNSYNNQLKAAPNKLVRTINNTLGRNRRILQNLIPPSEQTAKATREKMLQSGFDFRYLTHQQLTRSGKLYSFCYDHAYLPLENDWYLIVKKKEE